MAIIGYQIGYGNFESEISALEDQLAATEDRIRYAATVSALPSAAGLTDGTLGVVQAASANQLPSIYLVKSGSWVQPLESPMPTISYVIKIGGGAGELPEDVVVASGADGILGVGWVLEGTQTVARPSGVAVTPLDPDDLTIGVNGAGLWRIAVELNYSSPAPVSGILTRYFLQRNTGSGFLDLPGGELFRLDQDAPAAVDGISSVGLVVNLSINAGDRFRVVVRHNDSVSHTYTYNKFGITMNQFVATPT